MRHRKFTHSCPWARYSKKLALAIETPRHSGYFTQEDAESKGMRLVTVTQGSLKEGHALQLYLLIDESDGIIADAKFQVFGQSALIGALEAACYCLVRKSCSQMSRLTADLVDRQLRDKPDVPAFPEETFSHLNRVIDAIEEACLHCQDLMTQTTQPPSPVESNQASAEGYPGWDLLNKEEQIAIIEEIIASDIRPYIELDAGGIQIVDLIHGKELIIAYQGACTTCHSSTGATLNAIQGILKAKISRDLVVTPDSSFFH